MANVWGVFVGDNGDQIEIYSSCSGPFPPEPGTKGYIAIGWPAIGDMRMFVNKYHQYKDFFRVVYYENGMPENAFATKLNMPWHFAFSISIGDWVICPASAFSKLLIGEVISDYLSDFHDETGLYGKKRADFVHYREVKWHYVIDKSEKAYAKLNRIGQLTISKSSLTIEQIKEIIADC